MREYDSALGVASALEPSQSVTLLRPHAAARAAQFFASRFPGRAMYAIKANPSPDLLKVLWDNGVTMFDVASLAEVELVSQTLPEAALAFMHPVKAPEAIAKAYFEHGVRIFSLDSVEELTKILKATKWARDLTLCVRLRVSSQHSKLSLAAKFGAAPEEAAPLLLAVRQVAAKLGLCFHVGSQAMSPAAYADAMEIARKAIVRAGVTVDVVDVGGGFPSAYPGMLPPDLDSYFQVIGQAFESLPVAYNAELWCEPGRALCAEYASLLVRVERRREDVLYINDGVYGHLFDAGQPNWRYPVALLRESGAKAMPFSLYGPTCDDMDFMKGPFELPADVSAGDYVEIGMLGAYGAAIRTNFNGFGSELSVEVTDEPMLTLYAQPSHSPLNVRQRAE